MKVSGNTVTGQVYSLQKAADSQIFSNCENADRTTVNGYYQPQFGFTADLGGQYIENTDNGDEHCYREGDNIYVMFPSGDTKELDLAKLVNISKYSGQDLGQVITCKDESGKTVQVTDNKVSLSDAGKYIVTYSVTDTVFFDKDGKQITNTLKYSWDVTLNVSLKDTSVPDARFEFNATKQKMGYYLKSSLFDSSVYQYLPFLAGLKIYDYNGKTEYLRFDGDNNYAKVAQITVTNKYSGNDALVEVKLTDGGIITMQFLARADSGGGSTYTGSIKTSNNVIYFVNDGTTSKKDSTTTDAYWYVDYYKFTGNNGVTVQSGQQTFNSTGSSASTPSGIFNTTIKYTVTYDANGGKCGQTTGYATSASTAVTLPTPTRGGYIFAGWYTASTGGTRVGGAQEAYTPSANITLYAQWGKPCTVTYDANSGSCDTASAKYTGEALTLPAATREGYWFIGWYDAANGGNKIGDAGAKYNPTSEITLYAHWQKAIKYTVTYNANGGSCGTSSATYQGSALTLPTPTRTGYTFNGWYTAASGGSKIGAAGASYTPSADITVYAQWTQNEYTITVSTNNATVTGVTNGQKAHYGDNMSVTVSFSKNNSKSLTVKDENGTTILSKSSDGTHSFTMPASNVTISASSSGSCVTPDTLVTLADGTQKRIDELTHNDVLKVWDFEKGEYSDAPIAVIRNHGVENNTIVTLKFSDGTVTKVGNEHGYYDKNLRKFVAINGSNASKYIGHSFVKAIGEEYETVVLEDVVVEETKTEVWSLLTVGHYNFITDGIFSISSSIRGIEYLSPFEHNEKMRIDAEKKQQDIEKYGLYTYEDFDGILTKEQFDALNMSQIKVSVEKGIITWDDLMSVIEIEVFSPEGI